MYYVLIIHHVDDYAAWKLVFDEAAAMRKDAGEIAFQLLHEESSDTHLVHFSQWSSLAVARQFFESDRLVEIRKQAGVQPPTFLYLKAIESGTL